MSAEPPDRGAYQQWQRQHEGMLEPALAQSIYLFIMTAGRGIYITESDINELREFAAMLDVDLSEYTNEALMDKAIFSDAKGLIEKEFWRQFFIETRPTNLEAKLTEEILEREDEILERIGERAIESIINTEEFKQMFQEALTKLHEEREGERATTGKGGLIEGVNELAERISKLEADIASLKAQRDQIADESEKRVSGIQEERSEPIETGGVFKLAISVDRNWVVAVNDYDDSLLINEKREREDGGDITVEISDGSGSVTWKVRATKIGHSILYERTKNVIGEFLLKGSVSTDLTYSFPGENEERDFIPEITGGKIKVRDEWTLERGGLFNKKYEKILTFTVGSSSWSVEVETRMGNVKNLKFALIDLMDMILLSGETIREKDDRTLQ